MTESGDKKTIIFIDGVYLTNVELVDASKLVINGNVIGKVFIKEKGLNKIIGHFTPKIQEFNGKTLWFIEEFENKTNDLGLINFDWKYVNESNHSTYRQITIKKFFNDKCGIVKIPSGCKYINQQKDYLSCDFKRVNEEYFIKIN